MKSHYESRQLGCIGTLNADDIRADGLLSYVDSSPLFVIAFSNNDSGVPQQQDTTQRPPMVLVR